MFGKGQVLSVMVREGAVNRGRSVFWELCHEIGAILLNKCPWGLETSIATCLVSCGQCHPKTVERKIWGCPPYYFQDDKCTKCSDLATHYALEYELSPKLKSPNI